jgi:hypothetical protein
MFESAGGDAGLWLSRLFGGGGGVPIASGSVPGGMDFGAALGAMNPGMTGFGAVPSDAFNASQPFTTGNTALGSASNKQLSDALGGLGKAAGGGAAGADQRPIMPGGGGGGAGIGGGRGGGVSLDALVQMLAKRRQALMPGGGSQGATGLLGF